MKKILLLALIPALWACKKEQPEPAEPVLLSTVTFDFDPMVGENDLILETMSYENSLGQSYVVHTWKYFISHIELYNDGELVYEEKDSYHYINAADSETENVVLSAVPVGNYDEIRFAFGIDSAHNVGDSTNGDIDPSTGMLWPMVGYRFSNFDGAFGSKGLAFHVGGNSNFRPMAFTDGIDMKVSNGKNTYVHCHVDINEMFSAVHVIDFNTTQNLASETGTAIIADNIQNGMFHIHHIDNP